MKLHLITSAAVAALGTIPGRAVSEEAPGCGCSADLCRDLTVSPVACHFRQSFVIPDETEPICAALQDSPDFQDAFGSGVIPSNPAGGPLYYPSGPFPYTLRLGTCSEAIAEEQSCERNPENSVVGSIDYKANECYTESGYLPGTNTTVHATWTCASKLDGDITSGFEDELLIFVETGGRAKDSCRGENTPVLTSQDWIEPIPGQRYMCYEFLDPNDSTKTYSALFMTLGNEPCDGPKPEDTSGGYTSKLSGLGFLMTIMIVAFI